MARKEKKCHYIYKTTNLLNGKYYIGMHSTDNIDDGYLGSGKRLRYSINKHGEDNHKREILEFVNSREELKKREEEIVNLDEIAKVECMNLRVGGQGGFTREMQILGALATNKKQWGEDREVNVKLMSARMKKLWECGILSGENWKGDSNPMFGKKHSDESKKKMSVAKRGKGHGKGPKNSQFGTCWITRDGENKKIKKVVLDQFIKDGWLRGRNIQKQIKKNGIRYNNK